MDERRRRSVAFAHHEFFPSVFHIRDSMGVCMTLLAGTEHAILVDTGYGLEDVAAYVRTLTDKPLDVLLTHGHHDHALGAQWFRKVWLRKEDFPVYETYTNDHWRRHVLEGARDKGLSVDEDAFLAAKMPAPEGLDEGEVDLGGLTVRVIACPGHTPGSAVIYVPKYELLLTGDDWNPCTWLFFPEALCAQDYRRNVRELLKLPFANVLCSHQEKLHSRVYLDRFMEYLTDDCLKAARTVNTGDSVGARTAEARLPLEQIFVFDRDKFEQRLGRGEKVESGE